MTARNSLIPGKRAFIEGVKKLFVVQCSIVICDRWLRFAQLFLIDAALKVYPRMTNGKRTLNNEQFLHTFIERAYSSCPGSRKRDTCLPWRYARQLLEVFYGTRHRREYRSAFDLPCVAQARDGASVLHTRGPSIGRGQISRSATRRESRITAFGCIREIH
jgi:hypothetical protein